MRDWLTKLLHRVSTDRQAVTASEYGLVAAVLVAAVASTFPLVANNARVLFQSVAAAMQ